MPATPHMMGPPPAAQTDSSGSATPGVINLSPTLSDTASFFPPSGPPLVSPIDGMGEGALDEGLMAEHSFMVRVRRFLSGQRAGQVISERADSWTSDISLRRDNVCG